MTFVHGREITRLRVNTVSGSSFVASNGNFPKQMTAHRVCFSLAISSHIPHRRHHPLSAAARFESHSVTIGTECQTTTFSAED